MLNCAEVRDEIDERIKAELRERHLGEDDILQFWADMIKNGEANASDRLRASENVAKCLGMMNDKGNAQVVVFQQLSQEQLALLKAQTVDVPKLT